MRSWFRGIPENSELPVVVSRRESLLLVGARAPPGRLWEPKPRAAKLSGPGDICDCNPGPGISCRPGSRAGVALTSGHALRCSWRTPIVPSGPPEEWEAARPRGSSERESRGCPVSHRTEVHVGPVVARAGVGPVLPEPHDPAVQQPARGGVTRQGSSASCCPAFRERELGLGSQAVSGQ